MTPDLHPAEQAFARLLGRRAGIADPDVLHAAALACRAPRHGHVCVSVEPDLAARLAATSAVGDGTTATPLVLDGARLYLHRYWDYERRLAAAILSRPSFSVITGGPGTGKTTRVRGIVQELAAAGGTPRVLLLAPTGKAAGRLREAVGDVPGAVITGGTIHSALGVKHGSLVRFWHDATDPLLADLVVVDEASMVDIALMTKLIEAVPPASTLLLVGDRHQLASIEAGAVLGDICLAGVNIVELTHNYRSGSRPGISALAAAINAADGDAVIAALGAGTPDVRWVEKVEAVRDEVVAGYGPMVAAALAGNSVAALDALDGFRVLCAHRADGARATGLFTEWLGAGSRGRAVVVRANDPATKLHNGDTGVIVDGIGTVFRSGVVAPSRLPDHESALAMTIHKAQGSQYADVVVVLPERDSPVLTRELLYTGVTRASRHVTVVGSESVIRLAVGRGVARFTGLRERLAQS